MVEEVLSYLNIQPDKQYLDVTFGAGGHTRKILEKEPKCQVIAIDWDKYAIETYGIPLQEQYPDRLQLIWGNFGLLYKVLKKEGITSVDGILADFGTSQVQIQRLPGFSFSRDSYLDMRMSPAHQTMTAADVIAQSSQETLADIFFQLGEEQKSRQVAAILVRERAKKPIETTFQLVDAVYKVVPPHVRKMHSATKVFQALRLHVNPELNNIQSFLPAAVRVLAPGGALVCISFHSLEDRLVKQFFKEQESLGVVEIKTSRVVVPTPEEVGRNPSARSAKLRVIVKN